MRIKQVRKKKTIKGKSFSKTPSTIIAIGASAGGLDALRVLLKHLPPDTGMSFIYVQHLSPHHPSTLASLLSRFTKMLVKEVQDNLRIEADTLYVCTPDKEVNIKEGKIKLSDRMDKILPYLPIDKFFVSLSLKYKNVVGIILSGNAKDGTLGLKAIKGSGGITFAQDSSAKYNSMPASAIKEGVVDYVLSPREMAIELTSLARSGVLSGSKTKEVETESADNHLKTIFALLQKEKGVDFSHYKTSTIKRRLAQRMSECNAKNIKEYIKLLSEKKREINKLYRDMLINVTGFFRDPEVFRHLASAFFPRLLSEKIPGETLRFWIPACSTGEEAYSMAMLIIEAQDHLAVKINVQIFASDLSLDSIQDARKGEYSKADLKAVSQKRLKRFFTKINNHYRVSASLREMCVFAPHNILRDPPFSKMDFISCRNLLIYFDSVAQRRAIVTMHFALNRQGFLLLGKSETISTSPSLFHKMGSKVNLYSKIEGSGPVKIPELDPIRHSVNHARANTSLHDRSHKTSVVVGTDLDSRINSILLANYMPACAVINRDMEIVQFRGSTSIYLRHPEGKASLNILKMTRPEFAFELRSSIYNVFKANKPIIKSGIEMKVDSVFRVFSLEVMPLNIGAGDSLLLVVFKSDQSEENFTNNKEKTSLTLLKDRKIKRLTEELNSVKAEIHSMVELQETANEQLQAANDEIVSSNEEFQTLNEELETSKEEIEASNEELISTNRELQIRNDLLTESYNYSEAIIETIHEPMIVLNEDFHIKSASKSFYKKFDGTKEETEGVSLFKLNNQQWNEPNLRRLLEDVISKNMDFDNFEITNVFKGIGEKTLLLNAHRILRRNNKEKLILLAMEDITERSKVYLKEKEQFVSDIRSHEKDKQELEKAVRRRTRQLEQKNKELERLNQDLTSFTYVSSHDLQEPLRKIQNFITCITEEETGLSKTGKKYFERVSETAKRMQLLIEDLLKYSRAKKNESAFESTSLNTVVEGVVKDLEDAIKEKKGSVKILPLGDANIIPFQFRQLFHNLIGNSLKFSAPDKPLQIIVRSKLIKGDKATIKNLSLKKNYLNISVTDNGIGFDPKYQERIFEVFQRLHSFEEYNGTGIGLAICKRIVENHNGIITATSHLNRGARFDIYIPIE